MVSKSKEERHLEKIDMYRKKLEQMMVNKDMKSDDEAVKLSQELDKLIVNYYKIKDK